MLVEEFIKIGLNERGNDEEHTTKIERQHDPFANKCVYRVDQV